MGWIVIFPDGSVEVNDFAKVNKPIAELRVGNVIMKDKEGYYVRMHGSAGVGQSGQLDYIEFGCLHQGKVFHFKIPPGVEAGERDLTITPVNEFHLPVAEFKPGA